MSWDVEGEELRKKTSEKGVSGRRSRASKKKFELKKYQAFRISGSLSRTLLATEKKR